MDFNFAGVVLRRAEYEAPQSGACILHGRPAAIAFVIGFVKSVLVAGRLTGFRSVNRYGIVARSLIAARSFLCGFVNSSSGSSRCWGSSSCLFVAPCCAFVAPCCAFVAASSQAGCAHAPKPVYHAPSAAGAVPSSGRYTSCQCSAAASWGLNWPRELCPKAICCGITAGSRL